MESELLAATKKGMIAITHPADWKSRSLGLDGQNITCLDARSGVILAGGLNGILRSEDHGRSWSEANVGLHHKHLRWITFHPEIQDLVFAGTEPAAIFISRDAGHSWRECREVADLRQTHGWSLPYSPEAGCIRGFAFHGRRGYAAAEVGGALRTDDGGTTWRLADGSDGRPDLDYPPETFIYSDVHSINVHPSSPDLVDAPTGGGYYRSWDGGKSWRLIYDCYCRAVWVDPNDPTHIILGPADNVDSMGRIEETLDSGDHWNPASNGLVTPWRRHMVERFTQVENNLFAVLSNGELLHRSLASPDWFNIKVQGVNAIAPLR